MGCTMNILYVYRAAATRDSGAGIHVREVVWNLALKNTVVLLADKVDPLNHENVTEIPMNIPKGKGITGILTIPYLFYTLVRVVSKNRIDIIYCRDIFSSFCAIFIKKLWEIPVIYEVNGILSDESRARGSGRARIFFTRIFEYVVFKNPDVFICVTEEIKKIIEKEHRKKKVYFVANGANTTLFKPIENAKELLGFDEAVHYVVYVGSFAPWQGVDVLIRAAAEVVQTVSPVTILLVGGDGEKELRDLVNDLNLKDTVIFTGKIPHADVPLYINSSDVCVTPKRPLVSGYSPLKLYEYMACGKPVVASRIKGFEAVETVRAGILVEPENPHDLSQALVYLLTLDDLRERMGKNGRAHVLENHSWAKVAERIDRICRETIGEE
jgi:starch synthase